MPSSEGDADEARRYRETAYRLWLKISPIAARRRPSEIETYGGQPNKQAADMLTTFDPGRMIWNGYTGAAGWMFRQALEGVLGAKLENNRLVGPAEFVSPIAELGKVRIERRDGRRECEQEEQRQQRKTRHGRMESNSRRNGEHRPSLIRECGNITGLWTWRTWRLITKTRIHESTQEWIVDAMARWPLPFVVSCFRDPQNQLAEVSRFHADLVIHQ